jgi:hypothetical protein
MVRAAAKAIKRRAPRRHELLKRFLLGSKFPAFTLLNGKFTLTAPKLISVPPTEPHVLRWIDELLRLGDTFFEVGAHYGWMSMAACPCVGGKGKVVAFNLLHHLLNSRNTTKQPTGFARWKL